MRIRPGWPGSAERIGSPGEQMEYHHERIEDNYSLTDRQLSILQGLIEEYITTAQPVGSLSLTDHPDIRASSATIRNEMVRLEEMGLLLQPHTSAGRIPTDLGYRVYVQHLIMRQHRQRQRMALTFGPQDPGIEATCRLLGELTKYTALAMLPGWEFRRLQHIELAPVGSDQLLVMLITDDQQVLHSLSTVTERPEPARLRQVNDVLNEHFLGKQLTELTAEAVALAMEHLPHPPANFIARHRRWCAVVSSRSAPRRASMWKARRISSNNRNLPKCRSCARCWKRCTKKRSLSNFSPVRRPVKSR